MHELGSMDWETYSEAGYVWNEELQKWKPPKGAKSKGLGVVGTAAYAEHPSTEVRTLSYRLPGETQKYRWRPGLPLPARLFESLKAGGVFKCHNAIFELFIWEKVATRKNGFPSLLPHRYQLRCTMATARVNGLPGGLDDLSKVLQLPTPKDEEGKRLIKKLSMPRDPTKTDPRLRVLPNYLRDHDLTGLPPKEAARWLKIYAEDDADFERFYAYCDTDLDAEEGAYQRMTPMSAAELEAWWFDQEKNWRGVGVDRAGTRNCIAVLEQAQEKYGAEFRQLTGGLDPTQLQAFKGWLAAQGVFMDSMDEEALEGALARTDLSDLVRRSLEIRQLTGSASVKKLYAMENQANSEDRLCNLFNHHGSRPGRPTGEGPQPLNLPKEGPPLVWCRSEPCSRPFRPGLPNCPWCNTAADQSFKSKWTERPKGLPESAPLPAETALEVMAMRDLGAVEYLIGPALLTISGCLRSLFIAAPGHELIASDYSSLQAVILAMLSGEQWRIDAFKAGKPIYLLSASAITGTSLEAYEAYAAANGAHHPDRQKIGKVAELALGFQGWIGAWRIFDDGPTFTDDEVRKLILKWRDASPAIVEFWGGQFRGRPWDTEPFWLPEIPGVRAGQWADPKQPNYFGVEGCVVQAIQHLGAVFTYRGIQFQVRPTPAGGQALIITLLSGRELTYHEPRLTPSTRRQGEFSITYMTHNTNPKYGAMGWVPMSTWGGRLTENIVMGHEVGIQRHGYKLLRAAGYPMVLDVYDEDVVEVPEGTGSIEEVERLMATMPPWAIGWPIKASGGWRGKRYRKG